jgi:hypothetical protein
LLPLVFLQKQNHRLCSVRCGSGSRGSGGNDNGTPPVVRAAVSAITELLRALSPSKKPRQAAESDDTELELPRSVEDVVAVLEADYQRAYFLTGIYVLCGLQFYLVRTCDGKRKLKAKVGLHCQSKMAT